MKVINPDAPDEYKYETWKCKVTHSKEIIRIRKSPPKWIGRFSEVQSQ